jgi:PRC-barrel domain protein
MTKCTHIAFALILSAAASAQMSQSTQAQNTPAEVVTSLPSDSGTVTHWYKQNVYDPQDNKIGEIMDVLLDQQGKAVALIIGVGGFLGAGEKDVAVLFNSVHVKTKENNKWYLVMDSTKDQLKNAKGFKYDRNTMSWMPEESSSTTGSGSNPRR